MKHLVFVLLVIGTCVADVFLHNPRGSNNRNCERNDNRNNVNRLFNSQNNAAGGYACPRAVGDASVVTPKMYYYAGSKLRIEWTSSGASCMNGESHCQIVLQYTCDGSIKDGTPSDANDAATDTTTLASYTNPRFGLHESAAYFSKCKTRDRNRGLFAVGQIIGNNATFTRQNPFGAEYGFECQEERDYYPYWHQSPWKDIAIFTTNTSMCNWYRAESQNVKHKGECSQSGTSLRFNNPQDCRSNGGEWVEWGAHSIPPPECLSVESIKQNNIGSYGDTGYYVWTIPSDFAESCVFRIRYNISSSDYNPWTTDSNFNAQSPIKQDPRDDYGHGGWLSLALNTNQYGRTFQDRSYVFAIRPRPTDNPELSASSTIWNLNVGGKRGNIVDVFPAIQYEFVPKRLELQLGDFIHIQWTGSDYNPNRNPNNAEGGPVDPASANNYRADRSNLVEIEDLRGNIPKQALESRLFLTSNGQVDYNLLRKMAFINQNTGQCWSFATLLAANSNNEDLADKDNRNCGKLNSAPTPYFDGGLVRMRTPGTIYYMCTRNNNFSNRGQKGTIIVSNPTTCFGKSSSAPDVCSGKGTCTSLNVCTCQAGFTGSQCEIAPFTPHQSTTPRQSGTAPQGSTKKPNVSRALQFGKGLLFVAAFCALVAFVMFW